MTRRLLFNNAIIILFLKSFLSQALSASREPFAGIMNNSDIPQFVVVTMDDAITVRSMQLFQPLVEIRDRYKCAIRATFFVSIYTNTTDCTMIKALEQGKHEIAVGTFSGLAGNPTLDEITKAMGYLNTQCGVETSAMKGFRAPTLAYTASTLGYVQQAGLLYDSSIYTTDHAASEYGADQYWPFTLENGYSPTELTCTCFKNNTYPNLWEYMVNTLYNANNTPLLPMNYPSTNVIADIQTNFDRHYNGNRAPLGIHIGAGWLQTNNNNYALKTWIEDIQKQYDDVHFVSMHEVLDWMQNPIKKRRYRQYCSDQDSMCYTPLPRDCRFGTFNTESCSCECNAGYCTDDSGMCTETTTCGDTDGNWSDWDTSGPCCEQLQLVTRTCTNPAPTGNGAPCNGSSTQVQACYPSDCANNGWSDWSDFSQCCDGSKTKTRTCLAAPSINAGRGCIGSASDNETCGPDVCEKAYYPDYTDSMCLFQAYAPEGSSSSDGYNSINDCCAAKFAYAQADCITKSSNPPVDGGWSDYVAAGPCCNGKQTFSRTCTNPAPANKGKTCQGDSTMESACVESAATNGTCGGDSGGWGDWSDYTPCCFGKTNRTRICVTPPCTGDATESTSCPVDNCTHTYAPDFKNGKCKIVPDGTTGATYTDPYQCCNNHFTNGIDSCIANSGPPIDGGWSNWTVSNCCDGQANRFRACNNPTPKNGGAACVGLGYETVSCTEDNCIPLSVESGASRSLSLFLVLLLQTVVAAVAMWSFA